MFIKIDVHELIRLYFQFGLLYKEIAALLARHHQYVVSERHLKRILMSCGQFRRKGYTNLVYVVTFIQTQLQTTGQLNEYRWVFTKYLENGLKVKNKRRDLADMREYFSSVSL